MTFPVMSGVSHFDPNLKRVQVFQTWHKAVTVQTDDALHILTTDNGKLMTKSMKHYYRNIITETITNSQPLICQHRMDVLNVFLEWSPASTHHAIGLQRTWIFLGWFFLMAVYLTTLTATATNNSWTPYELWFGWKPSLSHLREIGCRAFSLCTPVPSKCMIYSLHLDQLYPSFQSLPPMGSVIISRF